jgi:hypothetical protein
MRRTRTGDINDTHKDWALANLSLCIWPYWYAGLVLHVLMLSALPCTARMPDNEISRFMVNRMLLHASQNCAVRKHSVSLCRQLVRLEVYTLEIIPAERGETYLSIRDTIP